MSLLNKSAAPVAASSIPASAERHGTGKKALLIALILAVLCGAGLGILKFTGKGNPFHLPEFANKAAQSGQSESAIAIFEKAIKPFRTSGPFNFQGVIVQTDGTARALINGQTVSEGTVISGIRIVEIIPGEITIDCGGALRRIIPGEEIRK